jgi:hypothetical protein
VCAGSFSSSTKLAGSPFIKSIRFKKIFFFLKIILDQGRFYIT